jgi:hypothetical protein
MQAKLSTMFVAGLFVTACSAVVLLPAGCQPSNQVASKAGEPTVCPVCGRETRTQPLTRLKYTTCICPTCKQVSTLDKDTALAIERAYGHEPGFQITVCEGCGAVMQECAVCREAPAQGPGQAQAVK